MGDHCGRRRRKVALSSTNGVFGDRPKSIGASGTLPAFLAIRHARKLRDERIAALRILNAALERSPYLLGETFTLADLNVAATLSEPHEDGRVDGDLDPADHQMTALADWLNRCCKRESWIRVRGMP